MKIRYKAALTASLMVLSIMGCATNSSSNLQDESQDGKVFGLDGSEVQEVGRVNVRPSENPDLLPEVTITPGAQSGQQSAVNSRDQACLAEAMYFEARGTGERGMRAVGEVILNRARDRRFPNTVCGVVDQRSGRSCQFSYRCDGHPEVYRERGQKALAERIAHTLLTNRGQDITNGALYFHAARMRPGWFASLSRRGQFGGNIFYR